VPRPKLHDDLLRDRLLDVAAQTVSEQGVTTLSLRTLASDAGTSTSAVYALFGGRQELLQALYVRAFSGFGGSQRAVPVTDDPMADLLALGHAYREWALSNRHLYAIMFGGALAGIEPDAETLEECRSTMDPLLSAVFRGLASGALGHGTTEVIAVGIWSGVHGAVSLELTPDLLPMSGEALDALYEAVLGSILRGWRA
jgi:AcrR family transcriptional regulator